jgi:hypothetical protein
LHVKWLRCIAEWKIITLAVNNNILKRLKVKESCPITGLNRPTGFQEVKAPRVLDIGTWRW